MIRIINDEDKNPFLLVVYVTGWEEKCYKNNNHFSIECDLKSVRKSLPFVVAQCQNVMVTTLTRWNEKRYNEKSGCNEQIFMPC